MQYIRFLKTPRYKPLTKRDGVISALITICTDLGESFLYRDITLIAIVRDIDNGEEAIAHKAFLWKAGMRSLKIEVPVRNKSKINSAGNGGKGKDGKEEMGNVILQISEKDFTLSDQLVGEDKVAVMSLWSSPLSISSSSEEMEQKQERVQRRIDIGQETPLCVFEETRDSIAKHIWDGGIAFTAYLTRVFAEVGDGKIEEEEENEGQEGVKEFDTLLREKKDLKVLELGAGCGIVGLTLSRFLPTSEITLTDLPTAHEICTHNLQFLPPSSRATFRILDWDSPSDISSASYDLVVIADCMYNSDAAEALVSVVEKVVKKETLLVITHKKRHESEEMFLSLLEERGLGWVGRTKVMIGEEETDLEEGVGVYVMRKK